MIQSEGKIKAPNAKASEAVQKVLFAKGYGWSKIQMKEVQSEEYPFIYWDGSHSMYCSWVEEGYNGWPQKAHTLADFNLTPEGEPLPKFKDGDRVVCDEALKQVISEGGLVTTYDAYKEPFTLHRHNSDSFEARNEYGFFHVSNRGIVYDPSGSFFGRILHAPTFGNLKPGDPNPFEVGMEVSLIFEGKKLIAEIHEVDDGPAIRLKPINGVRQWVGWYEDGTVHHGLYNINNVFPVSQSQPEQPKGLTMEDIEVGASYVVREDLEEGKYYGNDDCTSSMVALVGKTITVKRISHYGCSINETPHNWTPEMLSHRVEQPKYEFGDKVKVEGFKGRERYVIAHQNGVVVHATKDYYNQAKKGEHVQAACGPESSVTHWPKHIVVVLNENYEAVVAPEGITVGCQTFPLSVIDELTAAREKFTEQ